MQLFCEVVERGNFANAAKSIGVTPAIVGRRIAALENSLGFVLLNRTTRKMLLTPSGRAYYEGSKKIIENLEELEDALGSEHQKMPGGVIRLSAPDGLGTPFLVDAIEEFQKQYPNVRFDLLLQNNQVDLIQESIDLAFRLSFDLQDSSYVANKFGETTFNMYAAQSYIESNGEPNHYTELKNFKCLHMGASRYGDFWNLIVDGNTITYRQPWSLVLSNTEAYLASIVKGMGIGVLPELFARDEYDKGNIVKIKGIAEFPTIGIYGIYPTRKHMPHRLRLFIDFLKEWFSAKIELRA